MQTNIKNIKLCQLVKDYLLLEDRKTDPARSLRAEIYDFISKHANTDGHPLSPQDGLHFDGDHVETTDYIVFNEFYTVPMG